MTSPTTWRPDDPVLAGLSPADRDLLTGEGLTPGTFAHLDVPAEAVTHPAGPVLAYDSGVPLVCTPTGVIAVEPDGPRPVSSSVQQFVASLARMARYAADVQATDDEDAQLAVVHAAVADLRTIDPAAWSDERHYWPVVAAQMDAGLL